jgi:hypothetical protein
MDQYGANYFLDHIIRTHDALESEFVTDYYESTYDLSAPSLQSWSKREAFPYIALEFHPRTLALENGGPVLKRVLVGIVQGLLDDPAYCDREVVEFDNWFRDVYQYDIDVSQESSRLAFDGVDFSGLFA